MSRPLHLVIDARMAQFEDGAMTYLGEVVPRLVQQSGGLRVTLIAHRLREKFWRESVPLARFIVCDYSPVGVKNQLLVPFLLWRDPPDIYFFPSNTPPLLAPGRLVFTIHDLTPIQHPPYFDRFSAVKTAVFRLLVFLALRRATRAIAVSQYTKESICAVFGERFRGKIDVVHHGGPQPTSSPAGPCPHSRPYYFYVGVDRPHKNLKRLFEAYRAVLDRDPEAPDLILAGHHRRPQLVLADVERLRLGDRVFLLGRVSQDELDSLFRSTIALVFPTLAEGFGLPILESMARNTAVITSDCSACSEVAGGAAVLVDPHSVPSIAEGMWTIWKDEDLRERLRAAGRKNCARFDWELASQQTLASLLRALDRPH